MEAPEARADRERVAEPAAEARRARGKQATEPMKERRARGKRVAEPEAARTAALATVGYERPGVTAAETSADPVLASYAPEPMELIVQAEQVERVVRRTNEVVPVAGTKAVPAPVHSLPHQERIGQPGRADSQTNEPAYVGEWKVCHAPRARPGIGVVAVAERLQPRAEVEPARNFLHQKRYPREYRGRCLRLLHKWCRSAGLPGERPRTGDRYG